MKRDFKGILIYEKKYLKKNNLIVSTKKIKIKWKRKQNVDFLSIAQNYYATI